MHCQTSFRRYKEKYYSIIDVSKGYWHQELDH